MSVDKVLETLLVLGSAERPLSAAEVAERLSSPLSSTYRHIAALKRHGLASGDGREAGFTIGPSALQIGRNLDKYESLSPIIRPIVQRLVFDTDESVGVMRAAGSSVYCADMLESSQSLRCSFQPGRVTPIYKGASAYVLISRMSLSQRHSALSMVGKKDREALEARVSAAAAQGYAETEGEVDLGIWGISAPIYSKERMFEGCITLMAPAIRATERKSSLKEQLLKAAAEINKAFCSE